MSYLDIIIPVKNEAENISELAERIDKTLSSANLKYRMIFVDDHSDDNTVFEIKKIAEKYPVVIHIKQGKSGKAFSILEGSQLSNSEYLAMIDGDLQYPPEVLPEMYKLLQNHGVVVANRRNHKTSFLRKLASKINVFVFERLIHGFSVDTQSGLKVFRREIIEYLNESDVSAWTFDMPLLHTALEVGYSIGCVDIDFVDRERGNSKINLLRAATEIGLGSIKLKLKKRKIYTVKPNSGSNVLGAGVAYKGRRFITHTHLSHDKSALFTFYPWQKAILIFLLGVTITGLILNATTTAIIIVAILTFIYFLDFLFSFYVLLKSLHSPPEVNVGEDEIKKLNTSELPVYTILCPLYKEAEVLPHFASAIGKLDWPKDKLDILLLLEEDDKETIETAKNLNLDSRFNLLVVPHSLPKTKPKACNYGLAHAKGEYVVIYDAEDIPDPLQLKIAYLAFQKSSEKVICLQSKLSYYNPHQNFLTLLFTAEYSLWFDLILPGLQAVEAIIPLGGTSNHFRTEKLRELHGWDPFNVTEDCDLGTRLFRNGYKTAIIDSVTFEEANSKVLSWIRQRSRWIKGYLQTYLVHMRDPLNFLKTHGIQMFAFQLVIGMRMIFILVNPILWLATISYFAFYPIVGPTIESLYPQTVFYMAALSLVLGNFIHFYNYMIGCLKRRTWAVAKYVYLIPLYWLLTSISAVVAFYQLFTKPHFWEKTQHGLHFEKEARKAAKKAESKSPRIDWAFNSTLAGGSALILSSILGNVSNFAYNAYLGREFGLSEFGTVSLISSIYSLVGILTHAIGKTVTYKTALLLGKLSKPIKQFWSSTFGVAAFTSLFVTSLWILATSYLAEFFNISILPLLLFTPTWTFALMGSVNTGFLSGNLKFFQVAAIAVLETLVKLILTVALVETGHQGLVYISIPASIAISFLLSSVFIFRTASGPEVDKKELYFPKNFFATSILTNLSILAFLSFDVMLAKHYLSSSEAGQYALLSLTGKIIYFLGGLFSQFVTPLISHGEGARKDTRRTFYKILGATALASFSGYLAVGIFGSYTVPILFGDKTRVLIEYLPLYGLAMAGFSIAAVVINYHQIKRQYLFASIGFLFALIQVVSIVISPKTLNDFVVIISTLAIAQLGVIGVLHLTYPSFQIIWRNIGAFIGVFSWKNGNGQVSGSLKILIFNWRDMKHVYAGGAEVYIHEIAKRWVKEGHSVTVFCGNDGKCKNTSVVDGVKVIRRGGFYLVYLWAFLYYIFHFRGKFDVVIDCENGIPFFTPSFVAVPKILLIHHVHQDVFRKHLPFPLSIIAQITESKLMPFFYRNVPIVTISESSKKDIVKLGWASESDIKVVNPGINIGLLTRSKKTIHPSFVYLGRLKHYKNVDVALCAFASVVRNYKEAKLTIAGKGEEEGNLRKLVSELRINESVVFAGFVSEKQKAKLLASSWAAIQPSSFEGWGITVIEANAAGTTVIASRINGLSDSVVDGVTGLLFPVRNEKVLAKAMQGVILEDTFREDLSQKAYEWSRNFSWNKSAREFLRIIFKSLDSDNEVVFVRKLVLAEN